MDRIPKKFPSRGVPVQRGVTPPRPSVDLGTVNRIPGSSESRSSRGRRGSSRGRHRGKAPSDPKVFKRWVGVGLGAVGLVICLLLIWTLSRQHNPPAPVLQAEADKVDAANVVPPISPRRATDLARRLLNARSASEIALLIRPGEIGPQEALRELGQILSQSGEPGEPMWIGAGDSSMAPTELVRATFGDFDPRLIILTPDEGGRWEIDFDAFVRHCDPPLDDFLAGSAEDGMVRIIARKNTYFNGPFLDDTRWSCYSLHGPDAKDPPLFGYCETDGDVHHALQLLENRGRIRFDDARNASGRSHAERADIPPFRVTVRLSKPEGAERQQYRIDEIVSDDWVVVPGRTFQQQVAERGAAPSEAVPVPVDQAE